MALIQKNEDCFAMRGGLCFALRATRCKDCVFYQNTERKEASDIRCKKRIAALGEEERRYIRRKYYMEGVL